MTLRYTGEVTQTIVKTALSATELHLESSGKPLHVKTRIVNAMVEVLQNIMKHSDELEHEEINHPPVFLMNHESNRCTILSGNPVRTENIPTLRQALEKINTLDKSGLKELYRKIIRRTTRSQQGAGLGLVEIARKSEEKLEWSFVDLNTGFSFFSLKVIIRGRKQNT